MSVEVLQNLSLVSFVLSAVFLVITIALFFLLNVPKLIGDLSGANARKAIENIRQQNETNDEKNGKVPNVNKQENITDKISSSGRLIKRKGNDGGVPGTEKFPTKDLVSQSGETSVLSPETTILSEGMSASAGETSVLSQSGTNFGNTEILSDIATSEVIVENIDVEDIGFVVETEIGYTGSSEIIE